MMVQLRGGVPCGLRWDLCKLLGKDVQVGSSWKPRKDPVEQDGRQSLLDSLWADRQLSLQLGRAGTGLGQQGCLALGPYPQEQSRAEAELVVRSL